RARRVFLDVHKRTLRFLRARRLLSRPFYRCLVPPPEGDCSSLRRRSSSRDHFADSYASVTVRFPPTDSDIAAVPSRSSRSHVAPTKPLPLRIAVPSRPT